jgi:hypothetical protein
MVVLSGIECADRSRISSVLGFVAGILCCSFASADMQVQILDSSTWDGRTFPKAHLCAERGGTPNAGTPAVAVRQIPDGADKLLLWVENLNPKANHNQGGIEMDLTKLAGQTEVSIPSVPGSPAGREAFKHPDRITPTKNYAGLLGYGAPCPQGRGSDYVLRVSARNGQQSLETVTLPLGKP